MRICSAAIVVFLLLCGSGHAEQVQLDGRSIELPVPLDMCALSDKRHKEPLAFARLFNPGQKLLLLSVPCNRLALYEQNARTPANTSLLFDTAEWTALLDSNHELLRVSNTTISAIKLGMQKTLRALNTARINGRRYPAKGPELRSVTIVDNWRDRIFSTSINRFQRPLDRGSLDRYTASGFIVVAPYVLRFSMTSYVKNENDLLAIAEKTVDALR